MALDERADQYLPQDNDFYRDHYHHLLMVVMVLIVLLMGAAGLLIYQLYTRPLPVFTAIATDGQQMQLASSTEPNLSAQTILRWASKAAAVTYTFDFSNYKQKLNGMRPYFTADGWQSFLSSADAVVQDIVNKQLRVNAVVAGTPVITNQGIIRDTIISRTDRSSLDDKTNLQYAWRVQIPFIVTYQSDTLRSNRNFIVVLTIVRVPTSMNAQGIGIDQFLMYRT